MPARVSWSVNVIASKPSALAWTNSSSTWLALCRNEKCEVTAARRSRPWTEQPERVLDEAADRSCRGARKTLADLQDQSTYHDHDRRSRETLQVLLLPISTTMKRCNFSHALR